RRNKGDDESNTQEGEGLEEEQGAQDDGTSVDPTKKRRPTTEELADTGGEANPNAARPDAGAAATPPAPPTEPPPPAPPVAEVKPDAGAAATPPAPTPSLSDLAPKSGLAASVLQQAKQSITVSNPTYADLLKTWDARRQLTSASQAQQALLQTVVTFRAMGGGAPGGAQAFDLALALVEEVYKHLDAGDADRALPLADVAVTMAPSLAVAHVALARARWAKNPGDFVPVADALWRGVEADVSDLRSGMRWLFGLAMALALTVVALLLALATLAGARKLRLFLHDAGHLFPGPLRGISSTIVMILVAALPLMVGAGPLLTGMWWLTLCWLHLEVSTRIVAAVAAVATAGIPYLVDVGAAALSFPGSLAETLYLAQHDLARADEASARLEKEASVVGLGVRGVQLKRAGNLEGARAALEMALKLDGNAVWIRNNLGCLAAAMGDFQRAQLEFERASFIDGRDVLALHNTATLLNLLGKTGASQDAWATADKIDHGLAQAYRDRGTGQKPKPHNVAFLDAPAPMSLLLPLAMEGGPGADRVADNLWDRFCPLVSRPLYPAALGIFLLAWAILSAVGRRFMLAVPCAKCGDPACRTCDGKDTDRRHCGPCYNAFLVRGAKVEAALKVRKDVQIRRYRTRQRVVTRGLGLLGAGLGHLFAGASVVGAVLLVFFAVGLGITLSLALAIPDPTGVGHPLTWMRAALGGVPMALAYLVSLVATLRMEQ
ncbi:MAG: hypothetical protein AB2A00_40850, partial [Myxococcota bacterium]